MTAESGPSATGAEVEGIRRPKRVAKKTYATEATVYKSGSRQFGEILLRKDHDVELDLAPQGKIDFVRACVSYAVLHGRIDILEAQLEEKEEIIRAMTDGHVGLRGIESKRRGVSVTDVSEVRLNPDVTEVRKASKSAFPQFGTEQVNATITVPEEVQPSGETITADRIEEILRLGFLYMGMSRDTLETNVVFERAMKVTDKTALINAVNSGLVPEEAVSPKKSKRVEVKKLTPAPKPK